MLCKEGAPINFRFAFRISNNRVRFARANRIVPTSDGSGAPQFALTEVAGRWEAGARGRGVAV